MLNLSRRSLTEINRQYYRLYGLRPAFVDLSARVLNREDPLSRLAKIRRARNYALHESINWGGPYVFTLSHSVTSWILALEDRRTVHGGLIGGEVLTGKSPDIIEKNIRHLAALGMKRKAAAAYVERLPVWSLTRAHEAADRLRALFYQLSGWKPEQMEENRLRVQQQEQIAQAIEDQKRRGDPAVYPFEKERMLLSLIRAGDQPGTRRVLNEMLAAMYMTSPELPVLRARAIEMMGYLTRTAVEDSPLMEHVIERNHQWMRKLIQAPDFEELSRVLMQALDDFIENIYLHGFNRSNEKVSEALEFIAENYMKPISLRHVASELGLSLFRVAHLVKKYTGKTVVQIIHQVRIQHANRLLDQTSRSCTDICYEVGYGDQSYFIRHFRRINGITPLRYRRNRLMNAPADLDSSGPSSPRDAGSSQPPG